MTTNRIDHTSCSHPRTPAGRRACRAGAAPSVVPTSPGLRMPVTVAPKPFLVPVVTPCTIDAAHCENCGSTDYEDVNLGDQGYTACCNELVSRWTGDCRNHHAR